ncbi:MAG: isochorismate synthase, partial [Actinomycetota bacterium]
RLISHTVALDAAPDLLAHLPGTGAILWMRHGEGLAAWGEAALIDPGTGAGRFGRASAAVESLLGEAEVTDELGASAAPSGCGPIAFGSFTFDPSCSGSRVVIPSVVMGNLEGRSWLTLTGRGAVPRLQEVTPRALPVAPSRLDRCLSTPAAAGERRWLESVRVAREAIHHGRLDKVVLARQVMVESSTALDSRVISRRLASSYPQCFTFCFGEMVGASPELLVRRQASSVLSVVLAGSAPRSEEPAEDARLGDELLGSHKNRWEHDLAVHTVREALSRVCRPLEVDHEPTLALLANVQHLSTEVRGRLRRPLSALELAGRMHPTAAVCGTPTREALSLIRTLEGSGRGAYAGPVGWVDARGDGEWALALRCAEVSGSRARLFAGAGIVRESDPEAELEETRLKLRPILSALDPA